MEPDFLLIGVDGGATEVKAHAVACDGRDRLASFELGAVAASSKYERLPGFSPLPVAEQLAERHASHVRLSSIERKQAHLWVEAACAAVAEVASSCGMRRVLVGIGMPGLKSPDGRGIEVINNGPRIPDYLDQFDGGLRDAGLDLICPVAALGSDADYCGIGEQYAATGLFRDVENAYYVGGGTGLADALKLRGQLVPFDQAKNWMLKSWQMHSAIGPTFEKLVSAQSLNERYAALVSAGSDSSAGSAYPEQDAADGEPIAVAWMNCAALALAELVFERLTTVYRGRSQLKFRGDAYVKLDDSHPYRGTLLDRVVIGQRLGQIYADSRYRATFGGRLEEYLASFILESGSPEMVGRYIDGGRLIPGFLCASKLRAAPALGAAIAAARAWTG